MLKCTQHLTILLQQQGLQLWQRHLVSGRSGVRSRAALRLKLNLAQLYREEHQVIM